jgi:hypothetical protein
VLLALTGLGSVVLPSLFNPTIVYAVTNGSITENYGVIMNSGAVETGNPEGRVYCIDEGTLLLPNASADLSNTGSGSAGVTWATLTSTQRFQIQAIGWLSFNNSQSSAASDNNMYLAAQCLIWDITTGQGLPANATSSAYGSNNFGDNPTWYEQTPNYNAATMMADMDTLLTQYHNFLLQPKFDTANQTIHLGQTATFTDSNDVLGAYNDITTTNGLKTSVSGNKLTVTPRQREAPDVQNAHPPLQNYRRLCLTRWAGIQRRRLYFDAEPAHNEHQGRR